MGGCTKPDRRPTMLLIDTHVLIWLRSLDRRLGANARQAIDAAWESDEICVSAFSFWELAMLSAKGRAHLSRAHLSEDVLLWRRELLGQGLIEIPVDGEIGIRANGLVNFHADPADRIIVATALRGHRLITSDERILAWSGNLDRLDARE